MQPELSTQPNTDLTPEDAKAALGLSTRLSEQLLMAQAPEGEMGVQEESTEETDSDIEAKVDMLIDQKLTKFKEELLSDLEGELENEPEQTQENSI